MSDHELEQQGADLGSEELSQEQTIESLASSYGWDPKKGDKSAEDYIKYAMDGRKVVREKNKEISEMRMVVDQLAHDLKRQKEVAYQQAMNDIQEQKQEAAAVGDYNSIKSLEQQELQMKSEHAKDPIRDAAVTDFKMRNSHWFDSKDYKDIEIQGYARMIDNALSDRQLPINEHLAILEDTLASKFPGYFSSESENTTDVEPVQHENNVVSRKRTKKHTLSDLNEAQRTVAKYLSDKGQMTVDDYIKKLVENGDL